MWVCNVHAGFKGVGHYPVSRNRGSNLRRIRPHSDNVAEEQLIRLLWWGAIKKITFKFIN